MDIPIKPRGSNTRATTRFYNVETHYAHDFVKRRHDMSGMVYVCFCEIYALTLFCFRKKLFQEKRIQARALPYRQLLFEMGGAVFQPSQHEQRNSHMKQRTWRTQCGSLRRVYGQPWRVELGPWGVKVPRKMCFEPPQNCYDSFRLPRLVFAIDLSFTHISSHLQM